MTKEQFTQIIKNSKEIGCGMSRIAFLMPDGNVMKTFFGWNEMDVFPRFCSNDKTPYGAFYRQMTRENSIFEAIKGTEYEEMFLPILEYGVVEETNLLYQIVPYVKEISHYDEQIDVDLDYLWEHDIVVSEFVLDEYGFDGNKFFQKICDLEQSHGIIADDIFDGYNIAIYDGHPIVMDYGMFDF